MRLRKYNVQLIYVLLLFCFSFKFINAYPHINANLVEFSLSLQNQKESLDYSTTTYEIETNQVGINWYEAFSKTFHGGLEYGYLDLIQNSNPLSSAQFSSGEYYGILFRWMAIDYSIASLTLNLNYRYNKTKSASNNQNSEFLWHKTVFSSELEIRPFEKLGLLLAAEYQNLSGEQLDFGNARQITPFRALNQFGYRFGVNFKPDPTASIKLEWLAGYRKGVQIEFKRWF